MDSKPVAKIQFSDNIEDYVPFFDHEWAPRFVALAERVGLADPGARMIMQWKAASTIRSMPWHLCNSVAGLISHQIHAEEPLSLKTIGMMAAKIEQQSNIGGIFLDAHLRAGLLREIKIAEADARQRYVQNKLVLDPVDLWQEYIGIGDMQLMVWYSELHAFSQLYFGYESFLKSAVRSQARRQEDDPKARFDVQLKTALGAEMAAEVWSDRRITFARLVRHAVVHNAAKVTRQLSGFSDLLSVSPEGDIAVAPNQTRALHQLLKVCVERVCGDTGSAEGAATS